MSVSIKYLLNTVGLGSGTYCLGFTFHMRLFLSARLVILLAAELAEEE